ncbi:phosphatase PAP2 family protein [Lacticaseibacillus sp. GG6-2]
MTRSKTPLLITLCAWLAASPLVLAVYQHATWLPTLDNPIITVVTSARSPWLDQVMLGITSLGNPATVTGMTIIIMLWLSWRRAYWPALFVGINVSALNLLNHLLKTWLQRPRPFIADPAIHPLTTAGGFSFPSGHATAAMALGGSLIILAIITQHGSRRLMAVLLLTLIIIAIGLSRIYVRVHYPTDVMAGYLIALGGLQLIWWLMSPRLVPHG